MSEYRTLNGWPKIASTYAGNGNHAVMLQCDNRPWRFLVGIHHARMGQTLLITARCKTIQKANAALERALQEARA